MVIHVRRVLLAAAALAMLIAGFSALLLSHSSPAGAEEQFTIAILDTGFNPAVCVVNRGSNHSVRWINKGKLPHQVRSVASTPNDSSVPLFETLVLQPGETSSGFNFTAKSKFPYFDALNPGLKGTVESGDGVASCVEAPPTPTPTNTPSVSPTATPTRTPVAPPTPDPRRAIIPMLAKDED